jgi:Ni/Co efflux regulator RcnB
VKQLAIPLLAGLAILLAMPVLAAPLQTSHQTEPRRENLSNPARHGNNSETRRPNWNHRPTLLEFKRQRHNFYALRRHHYRRTYQPAQGFHYRRWIAGAVVSRGFWAAPYRIFDYWLYGLPVPPIACEWVQYDRDLLLIDTRAGVVVEVIYDFFG